MLLIRLAAFAGLNQSKVDTGVEQERCSSAQVVVAASGLSRGSEWVLRGVSGYCAGTISLNIIVRAISIPFRSTSTAVYRWPQVSTVVYSSRIRARLYRWPAERGIGRSLRHCC